MLQLLVYASLQVPAGVLLDRFGARKLIVTGALIMAGGQLLLAVADGLPFAITARVLVGAGDALTFISVLAVVVAWFPARQVPLMTQLTGLVGQLGQVLWAIPFAALLHGPGWATAFGSAGALGVAVAVAVLAVLRNRPPGAPAPPRAATPRQVLDSLRHAWREPGTRLGLWTHTGTQFSGTVFALLWGVPYLVAGQGMTTAGASALLTLFVIVGIIAGPLFGEFSARHPLRRSWLVITVIVITAVVWTVVLAVPPPAPRWLLVGLVVVLALGAPGSMIGFDYARTFNPDHRQGTAVGIVNVGGFVASLVVTFGVGSRSSGPAATRPRGSGSPGASSTRCGRSRWSVCSWPGGRRGASCAAEGVRVPPLREVLARRRR